MSYTSEKSCQVCVRVPKELHEKLAKATARGKPYAPTKSQVITRGIALALAELEKKRGQS